VRARDDDGVELNAAFTVEPDAPYLSLVLESAGGRTVGSDRPRNDQYVPALALLLQRLGDRRAVLVSALVASARVSTVPESERILLQGPLDLASVTDFEELRLDITRAQGRVGLPAGAAKEGNNRKRLQLRLDVPGYGPGDAGKLAADLAAPSTRALRAWPTASELLRSLIGEEIRTVTGMPNMVLAVHSDTALVRTTRSPDGQPTQPGPRGGRDHRRAGRPARVRVPARAGRSRRGPEGPRQAQDERVGAGKRRGAGTPQRFRRGRAGNIARRAVHDEPGHDHARRGGERDSGQRPGVYRPGRVASVKVRKEQALLRNLLAGNRELADCTLCGQEYPMGFLVAAHVKKRSICSDDERRDLRNVAMLACTFGCHALYEAGWITVGQDGNVQTVPLDSLPEGRIREHLKHLAGHRCAAHSLASERYFAWHRMTIFRGRS
jgi:hypothetical protein